MKAVQEITSVQVPGGGSAGSGAGAGGGGGVAMPTYAGGGASASMPTISTTGGANPATQISQTIQGASSQPTRAYVVSTDISSQQQLDRRVSLAARMGDRRSNRGATFANG